MTTNQSIILIFVIVVIVIGGIIMWSYTPNSTTPLPDGQTPTSTPPVSTSTPLQSLTLAGGEISLRYSSDTFGLATTPAQILVTSYIPSCDQKLDYCFYYLGNAYQGTNFESAGLRIVRRKDLTTERLCLNTPPEGYSASTKPSSTFSSDTYTTSVFSPVGDAGAGHVAEGSLYRLFMRASSSCYEFETRIGTSQFANYPSGTIKEFTIGDKNTVRNSLETILKSATIAASGTAVQFP